MKLIYKVLPWALVALFATEIVAVLMPKKDGEFHVREFGRLPVLLNGRIQPFDSVARNTLLQIRSTGDVPLELLPSWQFWRHPKKLRSTEWLLEVFCRPEVADTRPIFLIHHPDLLSEFNLREKGIEKSGLRYYTFDELTPVLRQIWDQGTQARQIKDEQRTPVQKQVVKLQQAVFLYQALKGTLHPPDWTDPATELKKFEDAMAPGIAAMTAREKGEVYDEKAFNEFAEIAVLAYKLKDDPNAGQTYPLIVPPKDPEKARDDWHNIWTALLNSVRDREIYPPLKHFAHMASAYSRQEASEFNNAVGSYRDWLAQKLPSEVVKGRQEFYFNTTKPFLHALIIYIAAFVAGGAGLVLLSLSPNFSESFRRSAFYLIILAGLVHTFGLIFRMHLEGRPPVTNLYSSAIFIGWGAMLLGLLLERFYRFGIGNIVAATAGFVTLIIAHNLALGGDTMGVLRAVLDTNFWLATHVVVVTLGYASTFVAGLLGILFILLGLLTPLISRPLMSTVQSGSAATASRGGMQVGTALAKMAYGIVCFATLFSLTGTVLGGIWADQSWGRFWGWDPKENGALIIVLWNAVILHARWGGLVRERGLMNMTVFGNIVTSWSWFGTNMLGVGLHSYGFMDAAFVWLMIFIASQLFIISLGLLPKQWWRSLRMPATATRIPPATEQPEAAPA
jgi:ABC-type transport system involved in cytochrome c biogenesis permease subunit